MSTRAPSDEPPSRRPRPKRAEVRRRLLDAAGTVFARRGVGAASVDEVARAAGLTKGAIYSNFGSKDELFLALLADRIAARLDVVGELPPAEAPAADWLRRLGDILTRVSDSEPEWQMLFLEFWLGAMRDPETRAAFVTERRRLRALIADAVEQRASELGVRLPMPPAQVATALLALSNGLAIERLPDPDAVPADTFGALLAAMVGAEEDRGKG